MPRRGETSITFRLSPGFRAGFLGKRYRTCPPREIIDETGFEIMAHMSWYLRLYLRLIQRPNGKCPFCAGDVPWTLLNSGTFACPTCNGPLHVAEASPVPAIVIGFGSWPLGFIIAGRMGLKGNSLLFVGFFGGFVASALVVALLGSILGSLVPPRLEPDPGPSFSDGGVLHIDSPPNPQKPPE